MIRLFTAIELPETHRARLAALQGGVPGARWVAPENIHLTLRFIGNVDEAHFDDVAASLARVRADAFDVAIEGVGEFSRGRRPSMLWAGVARNPALIHLYDRIDAALVRAGCDPDPRKFTPHVTLARLKDTPMGRVREFLTEHGLLRLPPFHTRDFVLFSSFLGRSGAIYRVEADYPLEEPAP